MASPAAALDAGDRVGEHANGVFIAALGLVQHGFVVHDFQTAGSVLAGLDQIVFGFIELMELAINLRHAQIDVGVIGHQLGQLLIDLQGVSIFFFGHERLAKAALVAQFGRIEFGGFAIGDFGFRQIVRLGVSVARRSSMAGEGEREVTSSRRAMASGALPSSRRSWVSCSMAGSLSGSSLSMPRRTDSALSCSLRRR